jgi:hypothetical protein
VRLDALAADEASSPDRQLPDLQYVAGYDSGAKENGLQIRYPRR